MPPVQKFGVFKLQLRTNDTKDQLNRNRALLVFLAMEITGAIPSLLHSALLTRNDVLGQELRMIYRPLVPQTPLLPSLDLRRYSSF
jgi:hypothetical protein